MHLKKKKKTLLDFKRKRRNSEIDKDVKKGIQKVLNRETIKLQPKYSHRIKIQKEIRIIYGINATSAKSLGIYLSKIPNNYLILKLISGLLTSKRVRNEICGIQISIIIFQIYYIKIIDWLIILRLLNCIKFLLEEYISKKQEPYKTRFFIFLLGNLVLSGFSNFTFITSTFLFTLLLLTNYFDKLKK